MKHQFVTGSADARLAPSLDHAAVVRAYGRWADIYDMAFGLPSRGARKAGTDAVNALVDARDVLEVGVGTGLSLPFYRRDLRVTGIDLSTAMLERARDRVATDGLTNVVGLHEMDAQSTNFADASFDVSAAMFTATVVPDARALLAEMRRVTRPGGTLLFVNHFAAERGLRARLERALAPLAHTIGWRPDFRLADLGGDEVLPTPRPCGLGGLFSVLVLPR